MRNRSVFTYTRALCILPALVVLFATLQTAAQSQAGAAVTQARPTQPDRNELLKVKPNIAGQRNGIFIEPDPMDFADHAGFTSLFDGKTLTGWDGEPGVWSVSGGAIVGVSTKQHVAGNTFLVYHGVTAKDFDLKLEIKVEWGGGSGIQYRSSTGIPPGRVAGKGEPPLDPRWVMIGPQADFWYPVNEHAKQYSGQLYSQNTSLGIIAWRGQVVESEPDKFQRLAGMIGGRTALGKFVKDGQWNQYTIIARGGVILHILNGQLMAVLIDDDLASTNNASGLFGLQIEGTPCKVSFRNIWLRKID
ncbi:MAG: 3-keto-disaccharide hydrolase [Terracidiphilus sp.]